MKGQIYKIHSDFYYVETEENTVEAKLKDTLKKQDISVVVGDFVEVELSQNEKQGFISKVYERKNFINHPKAANIDQVIIVSSIEEPRLDFEQLDRYIAFCEYYKLKIVLCFNKNDLSFDKSINKRIEDIYEPLGYEIIFISALTGKGTVDFIKLLENKVSLLCGASGVGKTTILKTLYPQLSLKIGNVSFKTGRGKHTTRHCEMIKVVTKSGKTFKVTDTPGFSHLRFNFLQPEEVSELFLEIRDLSDCKYKNCIHINEKGCNILANIDKIPKVRYDSYLKFVEEAKEFKIQVITNGNKTESKSKNINNCQKVKISSKKRQITRRKLKQNFDCIKGVKNNTDD